MSARHSSSSEHALAESLRLQQDPATRSGECRDYLAGREKQIRHQHDLGADGLETARARSASLDQVVDALYRTLPDPVPEAALVAIGAYGRGALNPATPPRFLLVVASPSDAATPALLQCAESLARLDLREAHPIADPAACIAAAKQDFELFKAMLDARLVVGSASLFANLTESLGTIWTGAEAAGFLARCRRDLRSRRQRHSNTVFLQEPNVKESCGGMDDYHAMRWACRIKLGTSGLEALPAAGVLTDSALAELDAAIRFLHRIRNELHYHTEAPTDRLTLMLQGVVAKAFHYPQRNVLRRTEALMRDYYRHTLAIYQHSNALLEHFQIEEDAAATVNREPDPNADPDADPECGIERFDGFIARDGRIHPVIAEPFDADPHRLMRLFLHCQVRHLSPSPQLRQLISAYLPNLDRAFRHSKANRETFQAILERKGEVASTLRLMHRTGVLGRYLPEFGALDCLVQHEFFHRYTADEHTLRCIDELDHLLTDTRPERTLFRRLLHEVADPYALYLAVILHDTGRAENVREHIDGSAMLAAKLCSRLHIQGPRRSLIMFLVDNHLTFWRTATTRNLEDPEVIAEFAAIVKTQANLDILLLFTFADSNGTAPDAWNGWKESLMLQLHSATRRFIDGGGRDAYSRQLEADRLALRDEVIALMRADYHPDIDRHFELMPAAAFHYREARHLVTQIRSVRHFLQSEQNKPAAYCIKWLDYPGKGYTELILATRDRPMLLEQLCCALAACEINILSADFFTRADHVVVDVFRVCTMEFETVADPALRASFLDCFQTILKTAKHEPERYLHHLAEGPALAGPTDAEVPVQARVSNHLHPTCTTVEIQAVDRIGILHDLFLTINQHGLTTAHARICTEKGVAMDTLYITTPEGEKVTDPTLLECLRHRLAILVGCPEPAE